MPLLVEEAKCRSDNSKSLKLFPSVAGELSVRVVKANSHGTIQQVMGCTVNHHDEVMTDTLVICHC